MNKTNRIVYYLPDYGITRGLDFGYYRYTSVQPKLETHVHQNSIELCFCIKGKQHYLVDDKLYQLSGNDILIVPPNTNHGTGDFPEDKGELFWLQINLDNSSEALCNLTYDQSNILMKQLLKTTGVIIKGALHVKVYLEKLMGQLDDFTTVMNQVKANHLVLQILLTTIELSEKSQSTFRSKRFALIDEYIYKNMHRIIYVDELAAILKISTGYFKTWFRTKAGITPKEYVNRIKIEHSKALLLNRPTTTEVAFELGFSSSQYFATTFKKYTGLTPKSYIGSRH